MHDGAEFCTPVLFGLAWLGLACCLLSARGSHLGLDVPPGVILAVPWGSLWDPHGRCFSAQGLGGKHMLAACWHVLPARVLWGPWGVPGVPRELLRGLSGAPWGPSGASPLVLGWVVGLHGVMRLWSSCWLAQLLVLWGPLGLPGALCVEARLCKPRLG